VHFSVRHSCYVQNCIMYMYNCRQFIGSTALYADRLSYFFRTHCTPSSSTGDLMGFFILEKKTAAQYSAENLMDRTRGMDSCDVTACRFSTQELCCPSTERVLLNPLLFASCSLASWNPSPRLLTAFSLILYEAAAGRLWLPGCCCKINIMR